ncbi:hypothetical protein [Candidatus Arsenophonus triatominarum]|uniref:hypothetical protein n=1 Tax=Candidatus Arsenophonus triatominarum TaxID=57911 RepID=UPI000A9C5544|nr:hypothetical protein [Candidatus Arsenophonus triatominarum]
MLETNCWDNAGKMATQKISMDLLTNQRQKSVIKYGKTRFLWINKKKAGYVGNYLSLILFLS